MAVIIEDLETGRVIRRLAAAKGTSVDEAVREACLHDLRRLEGDALWARLQPVLARVASYPPHKDQPTSDKQFFDAMWDETR